jgi:hypothetical protein
MVYGWYILRADKIDYIYTLLVKDDTFTWISFLISVMLILEHVAS